MTKISATAVAHLPLLHQLSPDAPTSIADLSKSLGRDAANTRKSVLALADEGLVERGAKSEGGVTITPAGARIAHLFSAEGEIRVPGDQLLLRHRDLEPDPDNERQAEPVAELQPLADSLAADGQLQNLVVRAPAEPGRKHRIVIGERRWRAVGAAIAVGGWPADRPLRCTVISQAEASAIALMRLGENLHRRDLHPLDEGRGFQRLRDEFKLSTEEIAARLGRSRRHVQDLIFVFENTSDDERARMRLAEDDPRRLRYTEARDLATRRKAAQAPAPQAEVVAEVSGSQAGDELPRHALVALAELAHKIHHDPAIKGAKAAAVFDHHSDGSAMWLQRARCARFFQQLGGWHGVITELGRLTLEAPGRPRARGAPYATRWLNPPPPAKTPASSPHPPAEAGEGDREAVEGASAAKPRSDAHALVGDDFSRQLREAADETGEGAPALADEIAPFPRHATLSFGRISVKIEADIAKLNLDGWPFKFTAADAKALRNLLNDVITELLAREEEA